MAEIRSNVDAIAARTSSVGTSSGATLTARRDSVDCGRSDQDNEPHQEERPEPAMHRFALQPAQHELRLPGRQLLVLFAAEKMLGTETRVDGCPRDRFGGADGPLDRRVRLRLEPARNLFGVVLGTR